MSEMNGEVEISAADVAPPPTGVGVSVTQGLPDVTMIVNEGNVVSPSGDDRSYVGGEQITVSGPDAIALAAGGHATVAGPVETEDAVAEEAPAAEDAPPVEGEAPTE